MSTQQVERDRRTGRFMSGGNGQGGEHKISSAAPARPEKPSHDITKTVIPFMSALVLCVAIFGAGTAVGRYLTGTDDRIGGIEKDIGDIKGDIRDIKRAVSVRKART
jgi:hypothetical protein